MAVCDLDGSSTSRELIRRVDALPSAHVTALPASPDEGRDAIRRGEVFAVLVIPRHFERDLLRQRPVQAIAYIDGQHMPVAVSCAGIWWTLALPAGSCPLLIRCGDPVSLRYRRTGRQRG
ncbi:ABC transporter permease [Desulfovibrio piger]|uniref:ABC transporter permease n=1 Tax=Desulfovibrio piger TaxID=901 RepID=UPI003C2FA8F8